MVCCKNHNNPTSNKINNKTGHPNVRTKTKAEVKQFNEPESGSSVAFITSSGDSDSDMDYESYSDNESTHKPNAERPATRPKSFVLADQTQTKERQRKKQHDIEHKEEKCDKKRSPPKPKRRRQGQKTEPPDKT